MEAWFFGGPLYHLIAGYGWNTVLACLIEPLAVVYRGQKKPFAQGRNISLDAVREFGQVADEMGFTAVLRKERSFR